MSHLAVHTRRFASLPCELASSAVVDLRQPRRRFNGFRRHAKNVKRTIRAEAGPPEQPAGDSGQPEAISLVKPFRGVEYTFMLAGTLKIATYFMLMSGTPNGLSRTVAGKISPYLMLPIGLGLAYVAKIVVDAGLHESKRFLRFLVAGCIIAYFGIARIIYKYDGPMSDLWLRRPARPSPAEMYFASKNQMLQAKIDEVSDRLGVTSAGPSKVAQYQDMEYYDNALGEAAKPYPPGQDSTITGQRAGASSSSSGRAVRGGSSRSAPRRRTFLTSDGEMSDWPSR